MKTLNKTARTTLLAVAALAILALVVGLTARDKDDTKTQIVTDKSERMEYLRQLGWETDGESEQRQEILLPREFDAVLTRYNELQKQQGFDLSDYAGLNATLYSYRVTNWPEQQLTVIAELYVAKGRVIGGDVHSTALDGFMIGLQ